MEGLQADKELFQTPIRRQYTPALHREGVSSSGHGNNLLSWPPSDVDVNSQSSHFLKGGRLLRRNGLPLVPMEVKRALSNFLSLFVATMAMQPYLKTYVSTKAREAVSAVISGIGLASGQRV